MSVEHYLQLSFTKGLGPILIHRLVAALGSARRACSASAGDLACIEGIGTTRAANILPSLRSAGSEAKREMEKAADLNITLLCPESPDYPPLLKLIPDPPAILYLYGDLQPRDLNSLAIVGSRKCSFYGREQSERFASLLAGAGFTVISGGARGIDTAAHTGALSHPQGRTLAVLGSALDVPYPPENKPLFDQIAAGRGAVLSEYPLGSPPIPENFPRRNRIVSGLSRAVLVIEADIRSGALITARQATDDHNRTVFALPGRVDNPLSAGPHKLIQDGAQLATNLQDILDNLDPLPHDLTLPDLPQQATSHTPQAPPINPQSTTLTPSQQSLLTHLTTDPITIDQLIDLTQLPTPTIMQDLTLLTLKGLIHRHPNQSFSRR